LVSKGKNFRLQCGAAPKTRSDHGTKADENRVHDRDDYDISRMIVNYAFADRTEYSVRTVSNWWWCVSMNPGITIIPVAFTIRA
jgi:hypothetical protein